MLSSGEDINSGLCDCIDGSVETVDPGTQVIDAVESFADSGGQARGRPSAFMRCNHGTYGVTPEPERAPFIADQIAGAIERSTHSSRRVHRQAGNAGADREQHAARPRERTDVRGDVVTGQPHLVSTDAGAHRSGQAVATTSIGGHRRETGDEAPHPPPFGSNHLDDPVDHDIGPIELVTHARSRADLGITLDEQSDGRLTAVDADSDASPVAPRRHPQRYQTGATDNLKREAGDVVYGSPTTRARIQIVQPATIRPATPDDADAIYDICLRTGDRGSDATRLYGDPSLPGSVFAGPYLSVAGTVAFVVVDQQGPGGYVLAALDTRAFEDECERTWWPSLRARHLDPGPGQHDADAALCRYIHHPPIRSADVVDAFPAHLHIDLLPRFQGSGIGVQMMDTIVGALRDVDIVGVHLGVAPDNARAVRFYERFGFTTLSVVDDERVMALRL